MEDTIGRPIKTVFHHLCLAVTAAGCLSWSFPAWPAGADDGALFKVTVEADQPGGPAGRVTPSPAIPPASPAQGQPVVKPVADTPGVTPGQQKTPLPAPIPQAATGVPLNAASPGEQPLPAVTSGSPAGQPALPLPPVQPSLPQSQPASSMPTAAVEVTQTPGAPVPGQPEATPKYKVPPLRPAATDMAARGRYNGFQGAPVSFNFDDADVYSVVQTVLGDLLRVNYIVDPKVKGRVTFRSVAPVARENVLPVMEVILRLNGIGVVEEAGIFRVIPITDIAKEPAPIQFGREPGKVKVTGKSLLQVVPILNIQSTEIVKLIQSFVSTNAVLIDVPRGNNIIIVDTDANVKRLLELVQIFDGEQFKRRKGEVYVYPVQNSKARDVATLLQQIFLNASPAAAPYVRSGSPPATPSPTGGSPAPLPIQPVVLGQSPSAMGGSALVSDMTRIFFDDITNSIIVVGTPEDYAIVKETIQKIDIIPRQVVLEGIIAEVVLTDNLSLGLAYSLKVNFSNPEIKGQIGLNPTTLAAGGKAGFVGSGFTFMGVDKDGTVRAMVSALASRSKGKLLAAPHILVADNREARIQVGQQVPITTSESITYGSSVDASVPYRTVQYKDIGIILRVKPQVNESGLVSLELDQEISSYSTQLLYTGSREIIIDKTEAKTNLVVADGETIIIGGLIREDSNRAQSGVPILHKIPVIGFLFGERSRETTRRELIILLTPHVLKTQQQARDATKSYVDKFSSLGSVKKNDLIKDAPGIPPVEDKGQVEGGRR